MFNFGTTEQPKSVEQFEDVFESALNFENQLEGNTTFEVVSAYSTPLAEKRRIRAYSPEYYEWVGIEQPKPKKTAQEVVQAVIKASSNGETCKGCDGTGKYHLYKYNKDIACAKCAGKGYTTPIDTARGKAYQQRKVSGLPMDTSHTDYVH